MLSRVPAVVYSVPKKLLTANLNLVPRLGLSIDMPLLPLCVAWCVTGRTLFFPKKLHFNFSKAIYICVMKFVISILHCEGY